MVILSPRFAVLACLCAALPLAFPPAVDAAHLHGGRVAESHASSFRSHHGPPSSSPVHSYDGKHHNHKAPHRRAPELPPLLRRYRAHDQVNAHDVQGHGPHDYANPKVSHSAFARSRYRRELGPHSRRSSVYVPGNHGDRYLVTRNSLRNRGNGRTGADRQSSYAYTRRQLDESSLVFGRIDIMGAIPSSNNTQRLASLMVESTPIDWTSGQTSAKAFQLNASMTNQTQFIMMPMNQPSNADGNPTKHVTLATEVFDESSAEMVMYCATYDPTPGSTSQLLMTPCTGQIQSAASANDVVDPCSDVRNDASSSNQHQSQIFWYDPSTGNIEPISAATSSSEMDASSDDSTGCAEARVRRDNTNSTTTRSATSSRTSTSAAPTTTSSQQARNVTLVYIPTVLEVPASAQNASNTASASVSQVPVLTTTITTTVMATVTATDPSTRTVTPAQAAVSASVSSVPSQSMSVTVTPSDPARSSRSLQPPSSSSSLQTTTTSKALGDPDASLQVEVVGFVPSTTSSSSSTSRTTIATSTATTTTSHSSASPSLDAQAVAASIAKAIAPPQLRAFVSAAANLSPP